MCGATHRGFESRPLRRSPRATVHAPGDATPPNPARAGRQQRYRGGRVPVGTFFNFRPARRHRSRWRAWVSLIFRVISIACDRALWVVGRWETRHGLRTGCPPAPRSPQSTFPPGAKRRARRRPPPGSPREVEVYGPVEADHQHHLPAVNVPPERSDGREEDPPRGSPHTVEVYVPVERAKRAGGDASGRGGLSGSRRLRVRGASEASGRIRKRPRGAKERPAYRAKYGRGW
jgi:hypothetical protein